MDGPQGAKSSSPHPNQSRASRLYAFVSGRISAEASFNGDSRWCANCSAASTYSFVRSLVIGEKFSFEAGPISLASDIRAGIVAPVLMLVEKLNLRGTPSGLFCYGFRLQGMLHYLHEHRINGPQKAERMFSEALQMLENQLEGWLSPV